MLKFLKQNYVNIIIAFVYTLFAILVYGMWTYSAWHLWYVTLIVILLIIEAGITISYFWLKSENAKKN